MSYSYNLSIVIPTINNPLHLTKLLNSIEAQSKILNKKAEVLIILQKFPVTHKLLFNRKFITKIRIINLRRASLSLAKNKGIEVAKSKIVCFLDDDVEIDKNYIKNILDFFYKNKKAELLFGSIKIKNANKYYSRYMNNLFSQINYFNIKKCLGSAMIYKKTLNNKCYFDEKFGIGALYPSSEETDFVLNNLLANRVPAFYEPRIVIFHKNDEFLFGNLKNIKNKFLSYGLGSGALWAKYSSKNVFFILFFIYELLKSFVGIIIGVITINKKIYYKHGSLLHGKIKGFFKYFFLQ